MPYPNEHAARQEEPGNFTTFRRTHPKGFPKGIDAIFGIRANGKSAIQSLRFDRKLWTPDAAKKWLKDHGFKATLDPASAKSTVAKGFWNGVL